MRIWLVNPFDPLPGEREQLGRYGYLARCLRQSGHSVLWWSSAFSHRFKRPVQRELVERGAHEVGVEVRLLDAPPYDRNISLRRLRNHRALARGFAELAPREPAPDLILASSPPLELAEETTRLGRAWNIPAVLDVQDQWPDNFLHLAPPVARPLARWLLTPLYASARRACRDASAIVGVAQGYVDHAVRTGGAKRHTGVFPLGVDLEELRAAIVAGRERFGAKWVKPPGQTWLLYSGSLSHNYDFLTVIRAAVHAQARFGARARFIITGTGELAAEAARIVRDHRLENVTIAGFLDFAEYAYVLSQADVGFNAAFPDALIYLPNKIFYYFAAGAAVLNTIPGECAEIVTRRGCGLNYAAGDVDGCFRAIQTALDSPDMLARFRTSSRRLADEVYDRRIVYAGFVRFLETLVPIAARGGVDPSD